jgi:hypothetical protein
MRWTSFRFWLITVANGLVLGLVLLAIWGTLVALAAMAPEVESWPLFTFGGIGVVLSAVGLYLTKLARTKKQRWVGWSIHGGSLALYVLVAVFITKSWLSATRRTFLLTDGYNGDFYVIHVAAQKPHKQQSHWRTTYAVPSDGVLVIDDPMPQSTNDEYTYVRADGRTQRIADMEYSTVPDTPQNRADLTPIMYFPRTGGFQSRSGCHVQFEEVYIGTKADLLKSYKQTDLDSYLAVHPTICSAP